MSIQADHDERLCDVCNELGLSLTNNREDKTEYSLGTMTSIFKRWKEDTHCPFCRLAFSFMGGRASKSEVSLTWKPKRGFNRGTDAHNIVFLNEESALSPYGSGREVQPQIDPALIKKWLQLCELQHGEKCMPKSSVIRTPENPSGVNVLRVIDTQEQCIVDAKPGVHYVALSYVWGQVISVRLIRENLAQFTAKGGLPKHALSKTVSDAIDLVNKLGERYLWVDSLCLLQDDADDMADGISKMDLVFLGATLTIIAAHGEDADAGLPGVHPGSREVDQLVVEVKPGIKMTHIEGVYDSMSGSRHNSRGWTLQEVTLSHRLLVFSSKRIYFRCRQNCWSEDTIFDKFPSQINEALHSGSGIDFFDDSGVKPLYNLVFLLFRYAARSVTHEYDMINGFTGMLRQLAIQMKSGLLEGIHTNCFDIGVLFWDLYPMIEIFGRRREFPSWSWAGWHGGKYGFSGFCGDAAQVNSWLATMTYIDWYKREPGTLKLGLVWDAEAEKEYDDPTENNIGYRATLANPYGHSVERLFRPELRDDEGMREDIRLESGDRSYHLLQFWAQVVHFAALDFPDGFEKKHHISNTGQDSDSDDANSEEDLETQEVAESDSEGSSSDEEDSEVDESSDSEGDSEGEPPEVSGSWAHIFKILDSHGTICGGVKLDDHSLIHSLKGPHEFILLSRVDRYESFFNNSVTTDRQIYWVLLIEWIGSKKVVAERRGVGFIFWDCLDLMLSPGKIWKEIVLA